MNDGWIYVEDKLPPLGADVVVIAEVYTGLGTSLVKFIDSRETRTGWGRTIECWHRDLEGAKRLAWFLPPIFERRKKEMREISTDKIKVGEHLLIDGVEYVAEEYDGCSECAFNDSETCGFVPCSVGGSFSFKKAEKELGEEGE